MTPKNASNAPKRASKPCKMTECPSGRWANASWCYRHYREQAKKKREESLRRKKERKEGTKKFQESERKRLIKKTWSLMSQWVRRKDADWRGNVSCFTCKHVAHWKTMQAGHFFHGKLDWDERNLKPQCWICNMRRNGCGAEYGMRLIRENGLEWVKRLELDANTERPRSIEDLKRIHKELTEKLEPLNQ